MSILRAPPSLISADLLVWTNQRPVFRSRDLSLPIRGQYYLTELLLGVASVAAVAGVPPIGPLSDHWLPLARTGPGVRGWADLVTSDPPASPGQSRGVLGPKRREECALDLIPPALFLFIPMPTLVKVINGGYHNYFWHWAI